MAAGWMDLELSSCANGWSGSLFVVSEVDYHVALQVAPELGSLVQLRAAQDREHEHEQEQEWKGGIEM